MSEKILPFPPWCQPPFRVVYDDGQTRIETATLYGYHALAALAYGVWRWLYGDTFWKTP